MTGKFLGIGGSAGFIALMAFAAPDSSGFIVYQQNCSISARAPWMEKQRTWLDEAGKTWTNDTLRAKLLAATNVNPNLLVPQLGIVIAGMDSVARTQAIDALIADFRKGGRGGVAATRSTVGAAGTRAFFMLGMADTSYLNTAMHRLMEAGPDDALAADVAVLEDHSRLRAGRKQLYGTHFVRDAAGKITLAPMEDSAHADMRRDAAGLPPFATALCIAQTKAKTTK